MENSPSHKSQIVSVALCVAQKYISMEHRVPIPRSGMTIVPNIPSTSTCIVYCLQHHPKSFVKFDPARLECACVQTRVSLTFPFVTNLRGIHPEKVIYLPVTKMSCESLLNLLPDHAGSIPGTSNVGSSSH